MSAVYEFDLKEIMSAAAKEFVRDGKLPDLDYHIVLIQKGWFGKFVVRFTEESTP